MSDDTSFSSRSIREFHTALTDGSIFGVPRYTTALLPPVTSNTGGIVFDTTAAVFKGCDGSTWSSIGATFTGGAITSSITTPVDVGYGVGVNGGFISQQSAGTPDQSGFWTGTTSNAWIIAENADKAFDFAHAATTDPTLFIHSHNQNTTQWISFSHTGSNGAIGAGIGLITFQTGIQTDSGFNQTTAGFAGHLIGGGSNGLWNSTAQTPDTTLLTTGTLGNSILIVEEGDKSFDFAHAQATDPTLFIHSHNQNTTQWLGLTHDGTNGVISVGTGKVTVPALGLLFAAGGDAIGVASSTLDITGTTGGNGIRALITSSEHMRINNSIGVQVNGIFGWQTTAGNTNLASMYIVTADTPDTLKIAVPASSNGLVLCEFADKDFDFAHAQETDPTLFIHSHNQATNQWIGLSHNASNARITAGLGNIGFGTSVDLDSGFNVITTGAAGFLFGGGTNGLRLSTAQTPDTTVFTTQTLGNTLLLVEDADKAFDFAHAQATDPTFFIHSHNQSTTEWIGLTHNGTDGVLTTGTGGLIGPTRAVVVNTGTVAPAAGASRSVYTNEGDGDGSIINLPTAVAGLTYTVVCQVAQTITINANTGDTIRMGASVSAAAGLISTATAGNCVTLVAINATEWVAISFVGTAGGTWTIT